MLSLQESVECGPITLFGHRERNLRKWLRIVFSDNVHSPSEAIPFKHRRSIFDAVEWIIPSNEQGFESLVREMSHRSSLS